MQQALQPLRLGQPAQRWRDRQIGEVDLRAHAAGAQDVAQVAGQAVAEVDGRRCPAFPPVEASQRLAQREAWRGPLQPLPAAAVRRHHQRPRRAAQPLQRQPRFAGAPAQVDVIAGSRCVAPQRRARQHLAEHGDADVQGAARGVAAHQRAGVGVGQGQQAVRKIPQPGVVGVGQGQRQGEAQRAGAHGGQVAQVDGERLVAEGLRGDVGEKVAALDQHVAGDGELVAGAGLEQGAVVADAQGHRRAASGALEVAPDQLELTHASGPAAGAPHRWQGRRRSHRAGARCRHAAARGSSAARGAGGGGWPRRCGRGARH